MKWLEIIELRLAGTNIEQLESQFKELVNEVFDEMKDQAIKSYRGALINSDYSVHLVHDSKEPDNNGSQLGLHIVSALKEFGLVNHSIWIEMQSD